MELEERMLRQQQREAGNPYKVGTDQWRAWASGWASGEIHAAMRFVKAAAAARAVLSELITEIINERDEARAAVYEIKHVAYHFLESGEERVSDSEVAFDLPNEDYDKLVALLGDAHPEPETSVPSPLERREETK